MRLVTASNKKQAIKISRNEWESIGKQAGRIRTAWALQDWKGGFDIQDVVRRNDTEMFSKICYFLGQQAAEDPKTIREIVTQWESKAPGFQKMFQSNGSYQTQMELGFQNTKKLLAGGGPVSIQPLQGYGTGGRSLG